MVAAASQLGIIRAQSSGGYVAKERDYTLHRTIWRLDGEARRSPDINRAPEIEAKSHWLWLHTLNQANAGWDRQVQFHVNDTGSRRVRFVAAIIENPTIRTEDTTARKHECGDPCTLRAPKLNAIHPLIHCRIILLSNARDFFCLHRAREGAEEAKISGSGSRKLPVFGEPKTYRPWGDIDQFGKFDLTDPKGFESRFEFTRCHVLSR
jgi:hypothetical protein